MTDYGGVRRTARPKGTVNRIVNHWHIMYADHFKSGLSVMLKGFDK